jgi:hypothetical protein
MKKFFSSIIGLALIASVFVAGNASAVYFDEEIGENVFTITYDFNGGATFGGEETYEEQSAGYVPSLNNYTLVECFDFIELEEGGTECHPLDVEPGYELDYVTVNDERHDLGEDDAYELNQDTTIVYYWKAKEPNKTSEDGNGNSITYYDEDEEREFSLTVDTVTLDMTDEELEEIGMPTEIYELGKSTVLSIVGDQGDTLAFLSIEACDANPNEDFCPHNWPFTLRLKLSDDMKGYSIYKLMYVDINISGEGELISADSEDAVICELDGDDYIVCQMPHLSSYALIGSNEEEEEEDAPNTSDNIAVYVTIFGISLVALITVLVVTRKTTTKE